MRRVRLRHDHLRPSRALFGYLKHRRRRAIHQRPVPDAWRWIVARNVPAFARLPVPSQDDWFGHAQVLLEEKHWEGCGGLELTDEIRVTIAMQAARLVLGRDADYFPSVLSILVYPTTLLRREEQQIDDGIWTEDDDELDGLAATDLGAIVISWDAVLDGIHDPGDGFNVVLHEFAHELDFQDGNFNGAPLMDSAGQLTRWRAALAPAYEELQADVEAGRETFLDDYGATDPTEFFAVLTESFFERPAALRKRYPHVYEALKEFYGQDPAA